MTRTAILTLALLIAGEASAEPHGPTVYDNYPRWVEPSILWFDPIEVKYDLMAITLQGPDVIERILNGYVPKADDTVEWYISRVDRCDDTQCQFALSLRRKPSTTEPRQ